MIKLLIIGISHRLHIVATRCKKYYGLYDQPLRPAHVLTDDYVFVMIYDAEVDPDAHAGSRGVGPGTKDKVGGHGDFNHDDVKIMKTSRSKGLYHIT